MPIKSVKMKISKNKKMRFFLMSQGSLNPKIRFQGQKVWPVARSQTDGRTDIHEREYRGHPFNVSEVCPSTNHQGSVHESLKIAWPLITIMKYELRTSSTGPVSRNVYSGTLRLYLYVLFTSSQMIRYDFPNEQTLCRFPLQWRRHFMHMNLSH